MASGLLAATAVLISGPALAALGASVTLVSGQPGTIYPGETTELQITLSNSNTDTAGITAAGFSNTLPGTLPNGLKIAGASTYTCANASGSVAPTGTLSATIDTQTIILSGATIPARASSTDGTCTIRIPVTAGTSTGSSATYNYTIASGAVTGTDSSGAVANAGAVSQSINVSALNQPTISKSFASSTLVLGGAATNLTITLTNSNPVPIPNFIITDVFPVLGAGGIIKVAAGAPSANCNNGGAAPSFAPAPGDKTITASGTLPARAGATNGTCTLVVPVDADHTNGLYSTGAIANTIDAVTQFTNSLGIRAAANASANVTVNSPLRVTKAFSSAFLASGQAGSLTITLTNAGGTALTITSFTDSPIDGITGGGYGLTVTGSSTTCAGVTAATAGDEGVSLTGGTIPANGTCTVTINFTGTVQTAGVPISYTNTIAQGTVGVTTPGIISQSVSAAIIVADDLRVTKTATPASAAPGNPVRYTVTVQNYSATDINNVAITDTLINGLTFLTGTINGLDYTPSLTGTAGCAGLAVTGATGATAPVFTIGTLPQRSNASTAGSCTVTFYAMTSTSATNGSSTNNQIPAGGVCYNSGATCNGGASNTAGGTVSTSTLSIAKAFNLSSPRPEGTITRMTITLTNQSANPMTGVSIADTLPLAGSGSQMRVATPANAASTCGSPTITAVANSTSVAMNDGTIPARAANGTGAAGTCVLQVDVVAGAGVYTNTATAAGTETYANGTTHTLGPVSANAGFTFSSSLSATKSFSPAAVSSGGRSTVTVRLANSGAVALANVALTDPFPAGMVLANPPNAYSTCSGSTSVTAVAGANSVSLSGADIAGSANCDFIFDVTATGSANWVNTIPIGSIAANGGISNQSPVVGTLIYTTPNTPSLSKAANPSTLTFPGQVSVLTITISNGTQAVSNLRLTDHFTIDGTPGAAANGMAIAPTPAAATTCPGGIVTTVPGATTVAVSGVALAASASCTVTVNITSTSVGGITNFIPVGAIVTDQGLSNTGQATTSLTTQSNIGVTKQFSPNLVKPGQRSRLRITFYNPTAQPASDLAVIDTLPAGVTVPTGANPATTCAGATVSSPATNQVQVAGGSIVAAAGGVAASCYAEMDVLVGAQGDYVNTIPAGAVSATSGGISVSNSQPTSDTLRAKSPVIVHKAIDSRTLDAGNPVGFTTNSASRVPGSAATLTIHLGNPNAVPLTAAAFTDGLPNGLVIAQTPNASTTCVGGTVIAAASGTTLRLAGATLPAAGSCTVRVDVLSNISGTYTNTIAAGAVTTFEGVSNEEPTSARIDISTPPEVSKQFAPAVIPPNGTSTLTIFLDNSNASSLTLSSIFTDTLPTAPGNIRVATVPNVVKTCPGAVTAVAAAGTISYASGATIPAGGCTISVDVTGTIPGVHTNNIPAGALVTNLGNNQQPANATLTVSTLGYISGRVFHDNNVVPNGTYQSGTDTPIQGTGIELRSGANCSGALVSNAGLTNPTVTDVLGNYLFAGLPAGTYSVCEPVQPNGTTNGATTAGTITVVSGSSGTAGTASNPTATTSQIAGIILNASGTGEISGSPNNNFAEIVPSSIAGTVFLDQNNNGVQNGADTGIAGVLIELLDAGNAVIATTTTAADGSYSFTGLLPGTYSVHQPNQPAGTSSGITTPGVIANGGTAGSATPPTTLPSRISTIILPPNTSANGNNFAEIPNGRTISGRIFFDFDNSGTLNGPDHGIGGQTVNLTGNDINGNPFARSTTTASDGTYSFTGVPEGSAYVVTQPTQPIGTTNGQTLAGSTGGAATAVGVVPSAITNISLSGTNTVSAENNFAEIPGLAPDLAIDKGHSPASFGENSSTGFFTITPRNISPTTATSGVISITDTLPAGMTVAAPATGTGWSCTGAVGASSVTCTSSDIIAAAGTGNPISLRVAVANGLAGQILTNTAVISGGGEPPGFDSNNTASDPVSISTPAQISGTVWLDLDHNRRPDAGEPKQPGWQVELLLNGVMVANSVTNAAGAYSLTGLAPGSGYTLRFRHPTTGLIWGRAVPNEQGTSPTEGVRDLPSLPVAGVNTGNPAGAVTGDGTLNNLKLLAGDNIIEQSLPLDPAGVVYDAVTRQPVSGAVITITGPGGFDPAIHLVGGNATITTGIDGLYQFLITPAAPSGTYTLAVTTYPAGYLPLPSALIPGCTNTPAVAAVPAPALIQLSNAAPLIAAPLHVPGACPLSTATLAPANQATTQYYYSFAINVGTSSDVLNNHIPLDPILGGALVVSKTTPLVNVKRGELVPYTVTATNTLAATLPNIDVRDQIPPGFRYRLGSATLNGIALEPTVAGRHLTWRNQTFTPAERKIFKLILVVGAGVGEAEYVNQAWALNNIVDSLVSNIASATVRVVPDPTFDCSDIIGKVFDDKNANGYQDDGEPGIPNVRVVTARGLLVTTDAEGRFHVACAAIPQMDRGSNFVMKLDERTLPSGYRLTTENPRDVRVTRGKMVKLNFGATVHRVVRLELAAGAFVGASVELAPDWHKQLAALPETLTARPSVLRIAYRPGQEGTELAQQRLAAVADRIRVLWKESRKEDADEPRHPLLIETELGGAQ